jgi:hypothetical protein
VQNSIHNSLATERAQALTTRKKLQAIRKWIADTVDNTIFGAILTELTSEHTTITTKRLIRAVRRRIAPSAIAMREQAYRAYKDTIDSARRRNTKVED